MMHFNSKARPRCYASGMLLVGIHCLVTVPGTAQQPAQDVVKTAVETDQVLAVAFSPDGKMVAGGGFAKEIKIWDTQTGKLQRTLAGHSRTVRAVAFAPGSSLLASGGDDQTIKLWDAETGELKRTIPEPIGIVLSVAFSLDGKTLVSAGSKWPAADSKREEGGHRFTGEVKLWDAQSGTLKRTLKSDEGVFSAAYSPDGKLVAISGSKVRLWDAETGALKRILEPERGGVYTVAFSPDGNTLAGGGGYGVKAGQGTVSVSEVRLWNAHTGELQRTLTELSPSLRSVAFSPDGKTLATGTSGPLKTSPDRRLTWGSSEMKLWDAHSGALLRTVEGALGDVWSIAFSPDGKTIVYCDHETVTLVEAETGAKKQTLMTRTMKPFGR